MMGAEVRANSSIIPTKYSECYKVFRMSKESTEEGLWEIREGFLEGVIFKPKFERSIGVSQPLD